MALWPGRQTQACGECDAIKLFAHHVAEGEQLCGMCGHVHRHRLFFPEELQEGAARMIAALQESYPLRAAERRPNNTRLYNAHLEVALTPRPRTGAIVAGHRRCERLRSAERRIIAARCFERTCSGDSVKFRAPGPPHGPDSGSASPRSAPSAPSSGASNMQGSLIGVARMHWSTAPSAATPPSLPAQAPWAGSSCSDGIQIGCDAWSVVRNLQRRSAHSIPATSALPRVLRLTSSPVVSEAGEERRSVCRGSFPEISGDAYNSTQSTRSAFTSATFCDANANLQFLAQDVSPAQLEARFFSATSPNLTVDKKLLSSSSSSSSAAALPRVLEYRRLPCPRLGRDMSGVGN